MIGNSETQLEASQSQERLHVLIEDVMQENKRLRQMMNESQDSFDAQSSFTKRQEDGRSTTWTIGDDEYDTETIRGSIRESLGVSSQRSGPKEGHQSRMSRLPFERILEQSWVYKRNQRNSCDGSFISSKERSHTWSVFSGFSLADVSILSVVAMPLTTMDLANGNHYEVEALDEGLTWPPEDLRWNLLSQEEGLKDWMTELGSEVEDEETSERVNTPLSNSESLDELDKITNHKSEVDAKDCADELCACTGCQGVSS